jgi:glycosyltransferase involved in cell wall biosynthesis
VDDGSPDGLTGWYHFSGRALGRIEVLRLRSNLGHQRAICVGLCHIQDHVRATWVVVMDSDGEDRPEDAVRLIQLARERRTGPIFAARRKRLEGLIFRTGYLAFRWLHRLLTGHSVQVGNFSILPSAVLPRLVVMPELWNHYAGAVSVSKVAIDLIPIDRGKRLQGRSHMNLASLVAHGIAGIATFQEIVASRLLMANFVGVAVLAVLLGIVVVLRLLTDWAVPGWATYSGGLLLLLALQLLGISFNLVFAVISNRVRALFVPIRDYRSFIGGLEALEREPETLL